MNDHQHIRTSVTDRIATVTLNRPDKLNAWTPTMEHEVFQAMQQADEDRGVRVIVLTGAGRAFCAGADVNAIEGLQPADLGKGLATRRQDADKRPDYQQRFAYFPALGKPVIAMVNGAAAGVGLVLAAFSDLRFAADTAVFSTSFSRLGLVAEHGLSWMLPLLTGHANALDLLLSGRKIGAVEALDMRLVNKVFPANLLEAETVRYARMLADEVSPRSLRVIKRQQYEAPFQSLQQATSHADAEMKLSLLSADFKEGIDSFLQKRRPAFSGQ